MLQRIFLRRFATTSRNHQWNRRWFGHLKTYLISFTVSLEACHFILEYVVRPRQAGGPSMLPTMSIVEYVLEEKIRHEWFPQKLRRGDVVTYLSPLDPNSLVCKRILGLPGDIILVDPTTLSDPERSDMRERASQSHVTVPKGHIWVQGDNATASRDSRLYGPVPISLVRGRLLCGIGITPGPVNFKWYGQAPVEFSSYA